MADIKELLISFITKQDNRHSPRYTSVVNVRCKYRYIPIYILLLLVFFFSLLSLLLHTLCLCLYHTLTVMPFGFISSCQHNNTMCNYPLIQLAKPQRNVMWPKYLQSLRNCYHRNYKPRFQNNIQ